MTGAAHSQPSVSVVVPTHDRMARLADLLASLRAQSLPAPAFEVVIVDDASSDDTPALLEDELAGTPLALRVVRRRRADGPAAARNEGWRAARAPLVAFIDDDCVADPRWLEAGLAVCAEYPGAIVQGRVDPIPAEVVRESPFTRTLRVHSAGPFFQTCNIFYPRSVLSELGGFDAESYSMPGGEDTDLAWCALERGVGAAYAPEARAFHAVNQIGPLGRLRVAAHWYESMQVYKRHPALRRQVFTKHLFWRPWHYALLRVLLIPMLPRQLRHLRMWLGAPYVNTLVVRWRHERGGPWHAPFYMAEDVVEVVAMLRASVLYRMIVL